MRGKAPRTEDDRAFDNAVGQRIKAFRLQSGMNQTQVAQAVGVTFQQLQKYEKGSNRVAASRLALIAKALGVTMADLLGDGLEPPPIERDAQLDRLIQAYQGCSPEARAAITRLAMDLAAAGTASANAD